MSRDQWEPMEEAPKGYYVWLLCDLPAPKGPTPVLGIFREGKFWGKTVEGWFARERILWNGQASHGMLVDGFIKGWKRYCDMPDKEQTEC